MRRPDLSTLRDRRVLITGAASGIGAATAVAAAAEGAQLFLTDIDADLLARTAAGIGDAVRLATPCDVSDLPAVRALAQNTLAGHGPMDVVMNVAGIAAWGTVENLEHRHWRSMIEVNLMGPIHVIECFVPQMIAAGRGGHLVNVCSAAGLIALPWHAAYSASKYGLRGVSDVLRFDLRPHGIGVSLVCPGGVATPLAGTVQIAGVDQAGERFGRLRAGFERRAVTPERAARSILDGVHRNRYLVYTSNDIRVVNQVQRKAEPLYVLGMRVFHALANRALPMPTAAPAR
ncbi:MAG: SDR family oxidoreductase [Jatrophihabitans sp.]|nr:MAG: SDR family oxidoreductase [Jatrophihabitans sp.]